jgi:hypothetical protein
MNEPFTRHVQLTAREAVLRQLVANYDILPFAETSLDSIKGILELAHQETVQELHGLGAEEQPQPGEDHA